MHGGTLEREEGVREYSGFLTKIHSSVIDTVDYAFGSLGFCYFLSRLQESLFTFLSSLSTLQVPSAMRS